MVAFHAGGSPGTFPGVVSKPNPTPERACRSRTDTRPGKKRAVQWSSKRRKPPSSCEGGEDHDVTAGDGDTASEAERTDSRGVTELSPTPG